MTEMRNTLLFNFYNYDQNVFTYGNHLFKELPESNTCKDLEIKKFKNP